MGGPGSGRRGWPNAKFTPELAKEITQLIAKGNYLETAAAACGVSVAAVRTWIRDGRRAKSGPKRNFAIAYKRAEAKAESEAVNGIRYHGRKTWQALAWYLERRHPNRWARREVKIEPAGKSKDGEPVFRFVLGDGD